MPDLQDRLRELDRVPGRDLWPAIGARTPGPPAGEPGPWRRIAVITLALAVAAGGVVFAWRVFARPTTLIPATPFPISPMANGAIAVACGEGWPFSSDICLLQSDGTLRTILTEGQLGHPSWSPDGTRLLYQDGGGPDSFWGSTIWVANADGTEATKLIDTEGFLDRFPDWSPDGRLIVFSSGGRGRDVPPDGEDLYVASADGTVLDRLTDGGANRWLPAWSPDGLTIVYVATERPVGGDFDLYTIRLADRVVTRLTTTPAGEEWSPEWSPDGSQIAFAREIGSDDQREFQVVLVRPDGSEERAIYTCQGSCAGLLDLAWSPDGEQIAFTVALQAGRDLRRELFVMNPDGSGVRQLTEGVGMGCCPSWQALPNAEPTGTPSPTPTTPRPEGSLDCPPGDFEQHVLTDVGQDAPGGPTTAEEAIEAFLSRNYPGFPAANFILERGGADSATYIFESDGNLYGTLHAGKLGDSWYIGTFEICSSQLPGEP